MRILWIQLSARVMRRLMAWPTCARQGRLNVVLKMSRTLTWLMDRIWNLVVVVRVQSLGLIDRLPLVSVR